MIKQTIETAVFGGGCFWCTEAIFKSLRGVSAVEPGYAGGDMENPGYHDVSTGESGHAEVVKIKFDPTKIGYKVLLDVFFHTHNPTTLNRQGNDVGTQYRSVIFYTNEEQKKIAQKAKVTLSSSGEYDGEIVTAIVPLGKFYRAEEYHLDYYSKNKEEPYCQVVISPKLSHLRQKYGNLLK